MSAPTVEQFLASIHRHLDLVDRLLDNVERLQRGEPLPNDDNNVEAETVTLHGVTYSLLDDGPVVVEHGIRMIPRKPGPGPIEQAIEAAQHEASVRQREQALRDEDEAHSTPRTDELEDRFLFTPETDGEAA